MMEHLLKYRDYERKITYLKLMVNVNPAKASELEAELKELEESQARLRKAVNCFSEPLRQILQLKYYQDESLQTIAAITNYSYDYIRLAHSWFIKTAKELNAFITY